MIRTALFLCAVVFLNLLAGCVSSPEKLFQTGRDARVFNPQTGRYEWPDQ